MPLEASQAIIAAGADIEAANDNDETALIWAAAKSREQIARALVISGVSVAATKKFSEHE